MIGMTTAIMAVSVISVGSVRIMVVLRLVALVAQRVPGRVVHEIKRVFEWRS